MTTEKEIQDQITKDYNRFWYSQYDAALPDGVIAKFREAIMFQNAMTLQALPSIIKDIAGMKEYDLKFVHVGVILNTIFATPFNAIFYSPEEAMDAVMEFKQIEVEFNKRVEVKSQEIEKKRGRLMSLSGITKTVPFNNGLTKN